MRQAVQGHTYRLRLGADGSGEPREIEFNGSGPEVALRVAHSLCGPRGVEMFEDGRKIATLKLSGEQGFWMLGQN